MHEYHDLELTLASHTPIVVIETLEEVRLLQICAKLALTSGRVYQQWSVTEGLRPLGIDLDPREGTEQPTDVLKYIKKLATPGVFILLDFHPYMSDPLHVRLIKDIGQNTRLCNKTLVFVSHDFAIPDELHHLVARFDLQIPDPGQIKRIIKEELQAWQVRNPGKKLRADREAIAKLANNLTGVTVSDAHRLVRTAIEDDAAITHSDLPEVMKAKYALLNKDGVIHFEYDTAQFSEVAGLKNLKAWLEQRKPALQAQSSRLDPPKGILLLGVQGCGKSLAAKSVAGQFGLPLLRLDFGALYNKYYGETEKNLKAALDTADIMAPCVLWVDEIEKGIGVNDSDEGVSRRVLGNLLTWMAERGSRVFLVATSNDIEQLPPELIRKGRMDEIFFVDLPDRDTRFEILGIHLRKRNLAPSQFDLDLIAERTEGFSGAEIEQVIVSALYASHAENQMATTEMLLNEIENTRALSIVMAEKIAALRHWAGERTISAG